ncbi:MAG: LysM peptidoglycan-binding domain-containing protein [Anaerolineaceae bacterium]|nr:LysM peptidoglycan-binding domain-containing protein [Anaerolineaceae bacterium]
MADQSDKTKICPTCGTRLQEDAKRCVVCGRTFHPADESEEAKSRTDVRGQKMPEVTLSLPVAIGLVLLIFTIGAGVFFLFLKEQEVIVEPTVTATASMTPTVTLTPTSTQTPTKEPTWTPLPPVEYEVKAGETCSVIAATFNISVSSIVLENNLSTDCILSEGQVLRIPQPTPTASPMPTNTLSPAEATEAACEKVSYTVQAGDTLSVIANTYNVSIDSIKAFNSLNRDVVYQGEILTVPLCERLPTPGPTATATLPPPYYAPQLLLPADGKAFLAMDTRITLQWESVGTLRQNESYAITVEDVTAGDGTKIVEYVNNTKFIIPETMRPSDNVPHIFRWWVVPVRQIGIDENGVATWDTAGAASDQRVFSWWGVSE